MKEKSESKKIDKRKPVAKSIKTRSSQLLPKTKETKDKKKGDKTDKKTKSSKSSETKKGKKEKLTGEKLELSKFFSSFENEFQEMMHLFENWDRKELVLDKPYIPGKKGAKGKNNYIQLLRILKNIH